DEAPRLEALLPSLAFTGEVVVVVDAATRDDTAAVAERYGARVLTRALDGFGPQRRCALELCREVGLWCLAADEGLPADAPAQLASAIATDGVTGWRLRRRGWFL